MHKPRGFISERIPSRDAVDALGRPSVYNLLPAEFSGLSAIGRLDRETSGLMLFTDSAELNATIRGGKVAKTYIATVSGAGLDDDKLNAAVASIRTPLTRCDDAAADDDEEDEEDEDRWTTPAQARVLRRWRMRGTSEEDAEEDLNITSASSWREHPAAVRAWREARRAQLKMNVVQELRADNDGAVVDVEIILREGRFHQVRRLVKRAGLRMRHLRRISIGTTSLRGVGEPGTTRLLTVDEVTALIR